MVRRLLAPEPEPEHKPGSGSAAKKLPVPTFNAFARTFLDLCETDRLRVNTRMNYDVHLRHYLLSVLARRRFDDVKPADILVLKKSLARKSLREAVSIPDVRLHDLRHSFASDALGGGVPLAIVGEMLGHRQPNTTKRYAHLANRVVSEALEHTAGIIVATTTIPRALPLAPFEPLRDGQWAAIVTLVDADRRRGGKPVDLRQVVDGIRWVLHTQAHWSDIPATYAASTTCWRWYKRWCADGTWSKVEALIAAPSATLARRPTVRARPRAPETRVPGAVRTRTRAEIQ